AAVSVQGRRQTAKQPVKVFLKAKKMTDIPQTQAGCKAKSRWSPLWLPRLFKATPHNSRLTA
ncbi:MAG: hypothetical protein KBE47_00120, partial [Gemmiger sp.]|nr:hypothetical protein [Gemmiger sp.]